MIGMRRVLFVCHILIRNYLLNVNELTDDIEKKKLLCFLLHKPMRCGVEVHYNYAIHIKLCIAFRWYK